MQEPFHEVADASALLHSEAFVSRWGQPMSIRVQSRRHRLPMPSTVVTGARSPDASFTCAHRCEAAILEHKRDTGIYPYLFLSLILTGEYSLPKHEKLLYLCEPRTLVTPRWFGALSCNARWKPHPKGPLFTLVTRLTPSWLSSCFEHYGEPDPGLSGHWLALRLLPRRRPCAVRLSDPLSLQVFIPLFHP